MVFGETSGGRPADPGVPATAVTVRHTWLDGSVPPFAQGVWINLDTGQYEHFIVAGDGVAELSLAPGRYGLLSYGLR